MPILLSHAFTNGPVNKPTQLSGAELPGRACFSALRRTLLYDPAGLLLLFVLPHPGDQEENLPFHMGRHPSPSLLIAVYGLKGDPQ